MGTIHILEGAGYHSFVLALLLIADGLGPLLKAVIAFTVAHSITLALATLGVIHLPPAPTEAIIALSTLFLAAEDWSLFKLFSIIEPLGGKIIQTNLGQGDMTAMRMALWKTS